MQFKNHKKKKENHDKKYGHYLILLLE